MDFMTACKQPADQYDHE